MSDEVPSSPGGDHDPARQLLERREQAWSNFRAARIALNDLRIRTNIDGWPTWVHRLPGGKLERAERKLDRLRRELSRHGVGAEDRRWGVLSGGETPGTQGVVGLEATIARLVPRYRLVAPRWTEGLAAVARACPAVREQAAEGDRSGVHQLTQHLLTLIRLAPDDLARRPLIDHLPGSLRPIPADPAGLRRSGPGPVEVSFEIRTSTIELDTITVAPALRGMGLGSANLLHLCRAADEHRMTIVGRLVPIFHDETAIPALAAWCRRYGFTVQERVGGRITRAPETPKAGVTGRF
ncbi:hypothetical protein IU443_12410 [Nocardia farcinica]|uniref:Uncharacterized protein n=2 Tax=Nocardia farcinica TaxID=37329 RepID=A0A0H5NGM1_NOCFR|nr:MULTISPECIES: hypothetical protein [Nocardia]AXK89166.1 hypothetical protein DXT66_29195 [Nocardia farcinica]MBA4857462.1 hypothetical protein [Nocardia farcinica]MBC9816239.1 hypothetical protein [Nocardia farcinica]MBF6068507.1 hypothetical protein [Nocardia farcinica]MBF6143107.1 hypothetical protein [Nocardia farcinica]